MSAVESIGIKVKAVVLLRASLLTHRMTLGGRIQSRKVAGQGEGRGGEDSAPRCLTAGCSGLQQGSWADPHGGVNSAQAVCRVALGWEKF